MALAEAVAAAGPEPEVVLEATFGWYWAADVLEEMGARVHLVHPLGNNWGDRRVKNDERDANDLVDLLRWAVWRRRGSPRRRCGSCGRWSGTASSWSGCGPASRPRCMP